MTRNIGGVDRIIRIVLGLAIIAIGVVMKSWWGVLGVVPLATAACSWCPAYLLFKISTCRMKPR